MDKQKQCIFIGTSGWSYPSWGGPFYPDDWPKSRWFEYYVTQFNSVEVNATFYRFFKDQTYIKWYEKAPPDFRYVLKAPQLITHRKYLKDTDETIQRFCQSASLLQEKLGLILLQLAPHMPYDLERLEKALAAFDDPTKVAVEFRHEKWLTDETRQLLTNTGSIFCAVDSPITSPLNWLTSQTAYIRLHGRKKWYDHNYTKSELTEITNLAKQHLKAGVTEVYIFFNNDVSAYAPHNALVLKQLLRST